MYEHEMIMSGVLNEKKIPPFEFFCQTWGVGGKGKVAVAPSEKI